MVSPMPAKAEPARFRPPDAACPTVGAKCRCVVDITRRRVSSRRGVRVGGIRRSNTGRDDTSYPASEHAARWQGLLLLVWNYLGELARDYNDCGSVLLVLRTSWAPVYIVPDP